MPFLLSILHCCCGSNVPWTFCPRKVNILPCGSVVVDSTRRGECCSSSGNVCNLWPLLLSFLSGYLFYWSSNPAAVLWWVIVQILRCTPFTKRGFPDKFFAKETTRGYLWQDFIIKKTILNQSLNAPAMKGKKDAPNRFMNYFYIWHIQYCTAILYNYNIIGIELIIQSQRWWTYSLRKENLVSLKE